MSPHFRYDKSEIMLQLLHGGVGLVSRCTGAHKGNVRRQVLGLFPRGKTGIREGRRMPREEYRVRKGPEMMPRVRREMKSIEGWGISG